MKNCALIPVFWISFTLAGAFAQISAPPAPTKPALRRTPAFSSWKVLFKYPDENPKNTGSQAPSRQDRIESISVIKTNDTYKEVTAFRFQKESQKWIFEGVQLMTAPDYDLVVVIPPPSDEYPSPDYSNLGKTDFDGLDWVSLETYKGVETYEGKSAYAFETSKAGKTLKAFLSIETQLPLYFFDGEVKRTYVYDLPPSAPLNPPEKFLKALTTHKKGMELLKRNPSPP